MENKPMGRQTTDPLLSVREAAELLNMSVAAIRDMATRGVLNFKSLPGDKTKYLSLHSVNALSESHRSGKRQERADALLLARQAYVISRANEQRLNTICDVLGFDLPALSVTEADVGTLYEETRFLLERVGPLDGPEVRRWASIFYAIEESYLALVREFTGDAEPWRVFVQAAGHLHSLAPHEVTARDPALRAAYRYLGAARDHLRMVAYFACRQAYGERIADRVFPDQPHTTENILEILETLRA